MGTRKKVTIFSVKTGTGVLRRHLYEHHANSWIEGCDKLRIPITAKEAQRVVSDYRRQSGQASANNVENSQTRCPFSNEVFVDAIVEFIVADDQVCTICVRIILDLVTESIIISPSISLRTHSCAHCL